MPLVRLQPRELGCCKHLLPRPHCWRSPADVPPGDPIVLLLRLQRVVFGPGPPALLCTNSALPSLFALQIAPVNTTTGARDLLSSAFQLTNAALPTIVGAFRDGASSQWAWVDGTPPTNLGCTTPATGCYVWGVGEVCVCLNFEA